MERKKLLSGLLVGIAIFAAFGTLVYLLNQRVSPVQACGEKCYYGWNCGANEVCAGWGLPGTQKKCQCRAGSQCVNGKCVKAHKECVKGSCQLVAGAGPNKCSKDCDCKCCDTDKENDVWKKGTLTIGKGCPFDQGFSYADECVIDQGRTYLIQGYCGKDYGEGLTPCDYGYISNSCKDEYNATCQNGRCVAPTNIPAPTLNSHRRSYLT